MASSGSSVELTNFDGNAGGSSQASAPRRRGLIVPNTLSNRIKSQMVHRRKFWTILAVVCALLILVIVLPVELKDRVSNNGGPAATVTVTQLVPLPSSSSTTDSMTLPSLPLTMTLPLPTTMTISKTTTTVAMSTEAATITPIPQCAESKMKTNVSFVGVYNPKVSPSQFFITTTRDATGCCVQCYDLAPRRCNGWRFSELECAIIYDYPGQVANSTCPHGYPPVRIEEDGEAGDFGGRGPCAFPESA